MTDIFSFKKTKHMDPIHTLRSSKKVLIKAIEKKGGGAPVLPPDVTMQDIEFILQSELCKKEKKCSIS